MSDNQVGLPVLSRTPHQELTDEIVQQWIDGKRPLDTRIILQEYPELAQDKKAVGELAYAEYIQRIRNGERLDPLEFAARFPGYRSTINGMFSFQEEVQKNPKIFERPAKTFDWPKVGQELHGFSLVRELGRGNFARVYLAREIALGNRLVALKVALGGGAEAEILGRLRHDNIVPVYSISQDLVSDMTLVCMPYLGRTTLVDVLDHAFSKPGFPERAQVILQAVRPGPEDEAAALPPSRLLIGGSYEEGVIHLGIQLAEALAFVHQRQIFHRDLKPSNVLVRPDGRPMLLDFNLSDDPQTPAPEIGGTPMYMSPEHVRAFASKDAPCLLDARSDLYSLGAILYELLSGWAPFGHVPWGEFQVLNVLGLLQAQRQGPQPLREINPSLDRRLAQVVERCLAFDPRERYQLAGDLARALRRCLSPMQQVRRRVARHPRLSLSAALGALAVVAAAALFLALRPPLKDREFEQGLHHLRGGQYAQAVAHFSRSLAEEDSARVYLARGRAHLKMKHLNPALEDFLMADQLQSTGPSLAGLAYCYSLQGRHLSAAGFYKKAIEKGFTSPVVYNNLGFSLAELPGTSHEARECFRKALAADPEMQIAHFNRAWLDLITCRKKPKLISPEALKSLARTFELGPASGDMHLQAAHLYVLAQHLEPNWKKRALDHLQQAVRLGIQPAVLQEEIFRPLQTEAEFQRLLQMTPGTPLQKALAFVQDPLLEAGGADRP